MRLLFVLFLIVIYLFLPFTSQKKVFGAENNSFITIVNPVRISSYTKDPAKSLQAEYDEIKKHGFPATWLLTYDAIKTFSLAPILSSMDNKQELGIFLEVTPYFASDSKVKYNTTNSWHRATSVFLSGYSQENRVKLIDTVFGAFKQKLGYYPKSVGAWWVDSFSLNYMKSKYDITGALGISDQYDLDGYQLWGTPWSTPFYPNKIHAGVPARILSDKLDVVNFRWAARDPLNGYISPSKHVPSLYSVQDYSTIGLPDDYYRKLVELYSIQKEFNRFGQVTVGLEADYSPETYSGIYARWLDIVKQFEGQGINVSTMQEFSKWYRKTFPELSPLHIIESDDILGQRKKTIWFQSNSYRVGLAYDHSTYESQIIDFRTYHSDFQEPFYRSPNKQFGLSINLPFLVDSVVDEKTAWKFHAGKLQSISKDSGGIRIKLENGELIFREDELLVSKNLSVPGHISNSKVVSVRETKNGFSIAPKQNWAVPPEVITIQDFSITIPFAIKHRIGKFAPLILMLSIILSTALIFLLRSRIIRHSKLIMTLLIICFFLYFLFTFSTKYHISQSEVDALSVLSRFQAGRVLVYDKDCLRCKFSTPHKPAAAAGKKGYVSKLSKKEAINDFAFSIAQTSEAARKILKDKKIDYVYLAKYENYIEDLPYLPQDLGLKRIYQNANAEIWKVL